MKPFTKQVIAESTAEGPSVGKQLMKLMTEESWGALAKISETPYDYLYLQRDIAAGISQVMTMQEFYDEAAWKDIDIPDEAKALLKIDRVKMPLKDLARMNGMLLHAAYPEFIQPVDKWGGSLSLAFLKQLKDFP